MLDEKPEVPSPTYALTVGGIARTYDTDKESERIRSHIGSILRLNSLVVLLGAGASFHIKGPQIRNSSAESIAALVALTGESLTQAERVAIVTMCPEATFNLETLLERLNSALSFAASTQTEEILLGPDQHVSRLELRHLRKKLNAALVHACNLEVHAEAPNPWDVHQAFFRKILSVRRDLPHTRVFTTNYDLAIEYALDEAGIDYLDGFKGTVNRSFHPEVYNQLLFVAGTFEYRRPTPVDRALYVYKLHGSINWRTRGAEPNRRVVQVPPETTPAEDDLAIIYPTQDKESSVLGFPYADLLRSFGDALQSPEVGFITIGYGFADAHINRIIDRALASNPTLQMLAIDPIAIGDIELDEKGTAAISFKETPIANYVREPDARIASLMGPGATFSSFAVHIMPDLDIEEIAPKLRFKDGKR